MSTLEFASTSGIVTARVPTPVLAAIRDRLNGLNAIAPALVLAACAIVMLNIPGIHAQPLLMLVIFGSALVSSIAGFAFSAICAAMIFPLVDDVVRIVQILMVCSIGGQALMVWKMRHSIDWRALSVFLAGGMVGLPFGLYLLLYTHKADYIHVIGAMLIVYAAYMFFRRPLTLNRQHALWDALAGFMGGITGGAFAFPSAPVTIWCSFKGWSKDRQRALYQPFILVMQIAAVLTMVCLRPIGEPSAVGVLTGGLYLPAMLLGTTCGLACFKGLSDRHFFIAVNVLMILSGLSLIR